MVAHTIEAQEDWNALAAVGDAGPLGVIAVTGSINTTGTRADELTITLEEGAHLTALSSRSNWYTLKSDSLTLIWDGVCNAAIQADKDGGGCVTVTLVGYPPDREPYVSAASTADVRFKRAGRSDSAQDADSPAHYTWVGDALAQGGAPTYSADLQSWDLLDALFPDNPHLWNAGKYLMRFGRKGDPSRRVVDLRKARAYLDRAIALEEARGGE